MSLKDIGKYDVSEEAQALKDKLASQDTENAGLRSRLMKREVELGEIKTSLNETLYKVVFTSVYSTVHSLPSSTAQRRGRSCSQA
ncbi:hypothetical protein DFH29DRAFT_611243 [Suillus ampliporus]|nr:hypothetical protein DFH29DRAFT_611243 [Suillus ampliporus]